MCLSDHPGFHCNMLKLHVEAKAFQFHLHLNVLMVKLPGHLIVVGTTFSGSIVGGTLVYGFGNGLINFDIGWNK